MNNMHSPVPASHEMPALHIAHADITIAEIEHLGVLNILATSCCLGGPEINCKLLQ